MHTTEKGTEGSKVTEGRVVARDRSSDALGDDESPHARLLLLEVHPFLEQHLDLLVHQASRRVTVEKERERERAQKCQSRSNSCADASLLIILPSMNRWKNSPRETSHLAVRGQDSVARNERAEGVLGEGRPDRSRGRGELIGQSLVGRRLTGLQLSRQPQSSRLVSLTGRHL